MLSCSPADAAALSDAAPVGRRLSRRPARRRNARICSRLRLSRRVATDRVYHRRPSLPRVDVIDWLLQGDPGIRWQVLRDLTDAPPAEVDSERARVEHE